MSATVLCPDCGGICSACGGLGYVPAESPARSLAKRGAAVQVARDAVVNRARDHANLLPVACGLNAEDEVRLSEGRLLAAVAELDRQEAALRPTAPTDGGTGS